MTDLLFRPATATDIDAVVALVESGYRGDASRAGWTTEADLLDGRRTDADDVRSLLARPGSRVVLAERAGALVACAHVERVDPETAAFGMFSVSPALQRGGVGKLVLAECERIARDEWRCAQMTMHVIDLRAELIAFYERRGYARTGATKPFPYGDERFGRPRRDDLRFMVLAKPL